MKYHLLPHLHPQSHCHTNSWPGTSLFPCCCRAAASTSHPALQQENQEIPGHPGERQLYSWKHKAAAAARAARPSPKLLLGFGWVSSAPGVLCPGMCCQQHSRSRSRPATGQQSTFSGSVLCLMKNVFLQPQTSWKHLQDRVLIIATSVSELHLCVSMETSNVK